jgi:uncharacterized protein
MKTVAIIGASNDRKKYGNKAVRAYVKKGWRVYPVNLKESKIEGLTAYHNIVDIPGAINRVSMYVPPAIGLQIIAEIAKKSPKEVYFNPGSDSEELVAKAKELGLKVVQSCSIIAIGETPSDFN